MNDKTKSPPRLSVELDEDLSNKLNESVIPLLKSDIIRNLVRMYIEAIDNHGKGFMMMVIEDRCELVVKSKN